MAATSYVLCSPCMSAQLDRKAPIAISIKNTFLHLDDDEQRGLEHAPPRRCASAPSLACFLEARATEMEGQKKVVTANREVQSEGSTDLSDVEADASSLADTLSCASPGQAMDPAQQTPGRREISDTITPVRLNSRAPMWQPGAGVPRMTAVLVPMPMPMEMPQMPGRSAMPAQPPVLCHATAETWSEKGAQQAGIGRVVLALKTALASLVDDIKLTSGPETYDFLAHTASEDQRHKSHILRVGQDAILRAANQSKLVYVMGYQARPFVTTQYGFECVLGTMHDKKAACWDVFTQGYCRRGNACRWEHAAFQSRVSVVLKTVANQ